MRTARTTALGLLLCLTSLATACDDEPVDPVPADLCERALECEQSLLLVAAEECAAQVEAALAPADDRCKACTLTLPCEGIGSITTGGKRIDELCRTCIPKRFRKDPHLLIPAIVAAPAEPDESAVADPAAAPAPAPAAVPAPAPAAPAAK